MAEKTIIFPCSRGDTVFVAERKVDEYGYCTNEYAKVAYKVTSISYSARMTDIGFLERMKFEASCVNCSSKYIEFTDIDINKTVFLDNDAVSARVVELNKHI